MSDLPIIIAFLAGAVSGYFIGSYGTQNSLDIMRFKILELNRRLDELKRLYDAREKK